MGKYYYVQVLLRYLLGFVLELYDSIICIHSDEEEKEF